MIPVIVDAENLLRRGIMASALGDLKSPDGKFTGGLYSAFTTMGSLLRRELRGAGPILMAYDSGRTTKAKRGIHPKRLKLLPEYKANRSEQRELLSEEKMSDAMQQVDASYRMFEMLGVPCVKYKQREADDIVGAATKWWIGQAASPVVVSGDHDMLQMVHWGARVYMLNRKVMVSADNFESEIGVKPGLFLLYKALIGDDSDNIAGVKGVGEKTAVKLIQQWIEEEFMYIPSEPAEQVEAFCVWAAEEEKPKVRQTIAKSCSYLRKVIKAINLDWSFGKVDSLVSRMTNPPMSDYRSFRRECSRYNMMSLISKHNQYVLPIENAAKRLGDAEITV